MANVHPIEPEELMAYLDGELAVGRAAEAAGHLASCEECQRLAEELRALSRSLAAWEVEEPAVTVIAAEESSKRRRPRWVWWSAAAGLAAASLGLLLVSMPKMRPKPLGDASGGHLQPFFAIHEPEPATAFRTGIAGAPNPAAAPLLIRTANIALTTSQFDKTRASLDEITRRHRGYTGQLALNSPQNAGRTLNATLRIPSPQFDQTLAEIRDLGRIDSESQGGQEVTDQVVDLDARIANAQMTEARLRELVRERTGKITDVLEVQKELASVREEIERMQAERKILGDRVSFAQLDVRITEEHHAKEASPLRDAALDGWRNVIGGLSGVAEFLLAYGPSLLLWGALLFLPARWAWKKLRH